jgi:integration host factor subunit beta
VAVVARKRRLTTAQAEAVINAIFAALRGALVAGERVEVRDFGVFWVKQYDGYEWRNPRTNVPVKVGPKKLPRFKAGKNLLARLDAGRHRLPVPAASAAAEQHARRTNREREPGAA